MRRGAHGFTLLEIAVALAILGIGVITVQQIFQGALRLQTRAAEETRVILAARQKLDEVFSEPVPEQGDDCPSGAPLPEGSSCKLRLAKPADVGLTPDEWEELQLPDPDEGLSEHESEEPMLYVVDLRIPWGQGTYVVRTFRYYNPARWSSFGP